MSMKQLRRIPPLLLAALLALTLAVGPPPLRALAAPTQQPAPELVGYFESGVLPTADTPGLVVGLYLYDEGSAELTSDYLNDEPVIVEVGAWTVNTDSTLTLTITGTPEGDYEAPIALTFQVDEDGALVVPGEVGGAFGETGLRLALVEDTDAATDNTATDNTATDNGTTDNGMTGADELLADLPADTIVYQSDLMPAAAGLQITLLLINDNTAAMVSDYRAEEQVVIEIGEWAEQADGSLLITLVGTMEENYAEPVALAFTPLADDTLALVDEGGVLFGDAGLTLMLISAPTSPAEDGTEGDGTEDGGAEDGGAEDGGAVEEAALTDDNTAAEFAPSGAYVSEVIDDGSEAGQFLVAVLIPDGTAQISFYYQDGQLPSIEIGTWTAVDATEYALTVTGTPDEAYAQPVTVAFAYNPNGTLTLGLGGVTLYPLADITAGATETQEPVRIGQFQSAALPAASGPGAQFTLSLYDDFSAEFASDYQNNEPAIVELGTWDVNDADQLEITLTGRADQDYDEPVVLAFAELDDSSLELAAAPEGLFGETGLLLVPLPLEPAEAEMSGADEDETPITDTAEGAAEGAADALAAALLQAYQSEILPAASSPGLQLTLFLLEDGSASLEYDYLNDDEIVVNVGAWLSNDDGTITVTLTRGPNGDFVEPTVLTLEIGDDDNLTLVEASDESVGLLDIMFSPVTLE